jgi:hypothetical protein
MKHLVTFAIVLFNCLCGCTVQDSQSKDFKTAEKYHAIDAYEDFLQRYPQGEFSERAKGRIALLVFERAKLNVWFVDPLAAGESTVSVPDTFFIADSTYSEYKTVMEFKSEPVLNVLTRYKTLPDGTTRLEVVTELSEEYAEMFPPALSGHGLFIH